MQTKVERQSEGQFSQSFKVKFNELNEFYLDFSLVQAQSHKLQQLNLNFSQKLEVQRQKFPIRLYMQPKLHVLLDRLLSFSNMLHNYNFYYLDFGQIIKLKKRNTCLIQYQDLFVKKIFKERKSGKEVLYLRLGTKKKL